MRNSDWLVPGVLAAVLSLAGCSGSAPVRYANGTAPAADSGNQEVHVDAGTKADLEATIAAVHKQMLPGGRWQYITGGERAELSANFARMEKLFDQHGTIDDMDEHARLRLLDAQNNVNAILTRDDGNRLICTVQATTGSHLAVKTCRTYAQLQKRAQENRDDVQKRLETQHLPRPPCGMPGLPAC